MKLVLLTLGALSLALAVTADDDRRICPPTAELWPLMKDCRSYMECKHLDKDEKPIVRKCFPLIRRFNRQKLACDWFWRVDCNYAPQPPQSFPLFVKVIRLRRFRWAGHVARMSEHEIQRKTISDRLYGTRRVGRPELRWQDGVVNKGGVVRTDGLRSALARLRNRSPNNNNQSTKQNEPSLGEDIMATASTALRRLHFRGGSRKGKLPSSIGSSQNTSTDSANTVITMVTVDTDDAAPASALLDDLVTLDEPPEPLEVRQIPRLVPAKRLKLLSKRYAKSNYEDETAQHGRGSSGFAAAQMTVDSEYGSVDPPSSPPLPDSPTSRRHHDHLHDRRPRKSVSLPQESTVPKTAIVVQQASVQNTSPEVEYSLEQKRVENMRLLEVATTLTPDQLREFEMKYGSPHHSRSQSVKPRSRPTSLSLPPSRTRVASMPNTGAEEHYYRLRHFSICGKGVINKGDYLRSRLEKSQQSVVSTNSASSDHLGPPSRQSSCVSSTHQQSYRVLMLGSTAVGKTSLISQFMTSEYLAPYDTSIDDDFGEKSVSVLLDGEESELTFVDHPSNQLSPDCWLESNWNANAYCVVYSTSDLTSFAVACDCLSALWANDVTRQKAVILVANKSDLVRSRVVTSQEGKDAARRYDTKFIETSVGLNHRVDELLVGVLTQIRLKEAERTKIETQRREDPKGGLFPKVRGRGTSASLKVKGLLSKVWARDSKSKSCENLHVL